MALALAAAGRTFERSLFTSKKEFGILDSYYYAPKENNDFVRHYEPTLW